MATVGEAIAATLIAQWSGLGGAQPSPIQYLVERPERDPNPTVADAIYVWLPLKRIFDPIDVAEVYRNVTYTIRIVCHTKTSSARQLEIENEVDRILNSGTVITGATRQRVKEINDISNRSYSNLPKYISEVIVEVFTAMEVSATAYGTATTSTLTTDDLIVNTSITGNPTAALGATTITGAATVSTTLGVTGVLTTTTDATVGGDLITDNIISANPINIRPSGNIVDYLEFDTIGGHPVITVIGGGVLQIRGDSAFRLQPSGDLSDYIEFSTTGNIPKIASKGASDLQLATDTQTIGVDQIADLLMFGEANRDWVPCAYEGALDGYANVDSSGLIRNVGANDCDLIFLLPKPIGLGTLALKIDAIKTELRLADADDYVDHLHLLELGSGGSTSLWDLDVTYNSAFGSHTETFTKVAPTEERVVVRLQCVNTDAAALALSSVALRCYYE